MTEARKNFYLEIADKQASKASMYHHRLKEIRGRHKLLVEKYRMWNDQPARYKIVYVLASLAHVCLAILAGINLTDIFYASHNGIADDIGLLQIVKALLPIIGILGLSLIIGMLLWCIRPNWDTIVPASVRVHRGYLIGSAIGLVIYFSLLYHVVTIGIDLAPENRENVVELIFFFGLLELFTGFFAMHGWEVIFYELRKSNYQRRIARNLKRVNKCQMQSARYYKYYSQISGDRTDAEDLRKMRSAPFDKLLSF